LVPITFLPYQFYLLLFVACFTVVFVVANDSKKRNIIGTDRMWKQTKDRQGRCCHGRGSMQTNKNRSRKWQIAKMNCTKMEQAEM
jgi:hypothetical protein